MSASKVKVTSNRIKRDESSSASSDEQKDNILIMTASRNKNTGKRIRDKVHCCLFCDKFMINMARHFELIHRSEIQVARILAMPKGSKKRKNALEELSRAGDIYHNCEVMSKKQGELDLVRRPSEKERCSFRYSSYGAYPHCLGFMQKGGCDCLLPTHFDIVLMDTKSLCRTTRSKTHNRPEFDIPSLALKLRHALKK
nr:unnamed protein product [Callosobruchus analis]